MLITDAARRAAEEERRRKAEQARLEAERRRAEQEAQRKAQEQAAASAARTASAQKSPAQKPSTVKPSVTQPAQAQPVKKAIPQKTGQKFTPSVKTTQPVSVLDPNGSAQRLQIAPVHTQTVYPVTQKDPSKMNWAELGALGRLTNGQGKGQAYYDEVSKLVQDPGSKAYDPYFSNQSTLQAAIDAFHGQYTNFDDKFFEDTQYLQAYEHRLEDTLNISKSGMKNWSEPEIQAYYRNKLEMARDDTNKASGEWSSMMTTLQDYYNSFKKGHGRAPTADEFNGAIDWTNYQMLQEIDNSRNGLSDGSSAPVILTKGIGYSREKIMGLYDALQHGETLDPSKDYTENAINYYTRWESPTSASIPRDQSQYDRVNEAASLTPSQAIAKREEIRRNGTRQEDAEFGEALYKKAHPTYDNYGIPAYTDKAYLDSNRAQYQDIIDQNVQFDVNGQGTFPKPGKDAAYSVKQAYAFWKKDQNEKITEDVESQWSKLQDYLSKAYTTFKEDADADPQYLLDQINWNDYPELQRFMKGTGDFDLDRPVYATDSALKGIVLRLQKGMPVGSMDTDYGLDAKYGVGASTAAQETATQPAAAQTPNNATPTQNAPTAPVERQRAGASLNENLNRIGASLGSLAGKALSALPDALRGAQDALKTAVEGDKPDTVDLSKVPEAAWKMLLDDGTITQAQIDEYKASQQSAPEYTGMTEGSAKAQASEVDTSKLGKDDLIATLQEVDRVLKETEAQPTSSQIKAKTKHFTEERQKIVDALKQLGMTDDEIAAALGTPLYDENGNRIPDAQQLELEEMLRQAKIDKVNQQLNDLQYDVPTDPVALQKRNAEVGGLYAKLAELDAGPTIKQGTGNETEVKVWHAPNSLEDLRTGLLDWSADVSKDPKAKIVDPVLNFFKPPELETYKALEQYHTQTGSYPVTDEDWKSIYDIQAQNGQQEADDAMNKSRLFWDQALPLETPRLVKELLSYSSVAGAAVGERTVAGFLRVGDTTARVTRDLYNLSQKDKYIAAFGPKYTLDQARAIDPVLDAACDSVDFWNAQASAENKDYSKSLGQPTDTVLDLYNFAVDQYLMSSISSVVAQPIDWIVKNIASKAVPYIEKLPGSLQKIVNGTGKALEFFFKNPHYELRAYSDYADTARQQGATEDDVHNYGLLGMFTNGLTEGYLGSQYEKGLEFGSEILKKTGVDGVFKFLGTKGKTVLEFLGQSLRTAAGESLEEVSEVPISALGQETILKKPQTWASIPQLVGDIAAGHPYDDAKFSGTMAGDMVNNAVGAFGGSLMTAFLFGVGGVAGSIGDQKYAEKVYDKVLSSPKAGQYVAEAAAIDARNPVEVKAEPLPQAPVDASKAVEAPAEESTGSVAKPAQKAPEKPVEAPAQPKPAETPVKASAPVASPEAQMLVDFKNAMLPKVEQALVKAEAEARTQQDVENGLLDDMKSPTHPVYFSILKADSAIESMLKELDGIDQQLSQNAANFAAMVRASVNSNIPLTGPNAKQLSFNTQEQNDKLPRDKEKMAKKVEDARKELKLLQDKYQAEEDQRKAAQLAQHQADVEGEVSDLYAKRQELAASLAANTKLNPFNPGKGKDLEGYLDTLTKDQNPEEMEAWRTSHEELGSGQAAQPQERETSWEMLSNDKNAELKANGRSGAEALQEKLASRFNQFNTGSPKDGKGIPMLEVPAKVYFAMQKKVGGNQKGASLDYESSNANFATRTKAPEEIDAAAQRLKTAGFKIVGQDARFYIVEDPEYTKNNAGPLAWIDHLKGVERDESKDMSEFIGKAQEGLSKRFYVVPKVLDEENGDPIDEAVYGTQTLEEAMAAIDEDRSGIKAPRVGETKYYVSRDVLSMFNEKYAAILEADKQSMSYEEYSAMVSGMIDQYAVENGLSDYERNRMYGAKNLYTKAGKPGWVTLDSNDDYVVFARENTLDDPMANAMVASVDEALSVFGKAVKQHENDRTQTDSNGNWLSSTYHNPATSGPKYQMDGTKSKKGTYYPKEGSVIYSYSDEAGKKQTVKLGVWDPKDPYNRVFKVADEILKDAYSIDVNTYFGSHRVNFTIERNYGQGKYGEYDAAAVATESDPEGVLRDMTREVNLYTKLIDDPNLALPTRQTFMRYLLEAQYKQTQKDIADLAERFRNGVYAVNVNPDKVTEYANLKSRLDTLGQMREALYSDTKAEGESVGAGAKKFYDSLKVIDEFESQITYPGLGADMDALENISRTMAAPQEVTNPDGTKTVAKDNRTTAMVTAARQKLQEIVDRMYVNLDNARVQIGGGALFTEYNRRIEELQAKIKVLQEDTTISDVIKGAQIDTLQGKLNRYLTNRYKMFVAGVDATSPSQLMPVEDGFQYNMAEMTTPQLVRLKASTAEKLDNATRRAARVGGDRANVDRYQNLMAQIDEAIRTKPRTNQPATVSSLSDGVLPIEVNKPSREPLPKGILADYQVPKGGQQYITSDQLPAAKDTRDTSGSRQAALEMLRDVFDVGQEDLDARLSKYLLPRLMEEAKQDSLAYQRSNMNVPQELSDAYREAENILSDIANGIDPFAVKPEPVETAQETSVGDNNNRPGPGESLPEVVATIESSDADDQTKAELKASVASVASILNPVPIEQIPIGSMESDLSNFMDEPTSVSEESEPSPTVEEPTKVQEPPKRTSSWLLDRIQAALKNDPIDPWEEIARFPNAEPGQRGANVVNEPVRKYRDERILEVADTIDPANFEAVKPNYYAEVLAMKQIKRNAQKQTQLLTDNINKLAGELKKEASLSEKEGIKRQQSALIERRTLLKRRVTEITSALNSDEAIELGAVASAVEAARLRGTDDMYTEAEYKALLLDSKEAIEHADSVLVDMPRYETMGADEDTVVKVMGGGGHATKLAQNYEIAQGIKSEQHKLEKSLANVEDAIDRLSNVILTAEGENLDKLKAQRDSYTEMKRELESQIGNMEEAANLWFRDSATNLKEALFGTRTGGKIPTSVGIKAIQLMIEGVKKDYEGIKGKGKMLARWVGDVGNVTLETNPKRVAEAFFGKYAAVINGLYLNPVAEGNAKIKDRLETLYEGMKSSGITTENSEIAHMYAEGAIPLEELKANRPDDYKQIIEGIKYFREMYDTLLDEINATLVRNGFDPVAKRKNYFPHFREGVNPIMAMLGMENSPDSLPMSLVGRSGELRPMKQWMGNLLPRTGQETDYGLIEGASRYVPGALQIIHQMNNIVRLRQLEETINKVETMPDYQELTPFQMNRLKWAKQYFRTLTDNLAGKKTGMDRAISDNVPGGRQILDGARWLKNQVGLSLTAYNSSVMLSQGVTLGLSAGYAPRETALAMAQMINTIRHGENAFTGDGIEQMSKFLTRKYKGKPLSVTKLDKFLAVGQIPTEYAERFVGNVFFRAVYMQGLKQGLKEPQAAARADEVLWRAMSSRNRGEGGVAYNSITGGIALQFAREAVNNVLFMIKDMPKASPDRKKGLVGIAMILLFNYAYNLITGKKTAFDPAGAVQQTLNGRAEGETAQQTLAKTIGAVVDTGWPMSWDFTNGAKNIPLVSKIGDVTELTGKAFGGTLDWSDENTYERIVSAGLGFVPAGAQIERTLRGAKASILGYSESNMGDVRFPVDQNPANVITALIFGERNTPEGRAYTARGGEPLSRVQDDKFRRQVNNGVNPTEAFNNTINTPIVTSQTIDAKNIGKEGDARGGYLAEKEAAKARAGVTLPTTLPEWAIKAYDEGNTGVRTAIRAWQQSNLTELLPKVTPDYVEQDGKRVNVTDENRSWFEDRYLKWFNVYMEMAGVNPTPKEIKKAVGDADYKAKAEFVKKFYVEK